MKRFKREEREKRTIMKRDEDLPKYSNPASGAVFVNNDSLKVENLFNESEIEITTSDIELKAKGYSPMAIVDIINVLKTKDVIANNQPQKEQVKVDTTKEEISKPSDESNDLVEVINMYELKDNIRLPRSSHNFRCPKCGQAFLAESKTSVKSTWIFRNATDENVTSKSVEISGVAFDKSKGNEECKDELIKMYKTLHNIANDSGEKVLLLYDEDNTCHCPLCKTESPITDWLDAYSNPLDYFQSSNICDICGDNGSIVMTEGTQYCECGHECLSKAK